MSQPEYISVRQAYNQIGKHRFLDDWIDLETCDRSIEIQNFIYLNLLHFLQHPDSETYFQPDNRMIRKFPNGYANGEFFSINIAKNAVHFDGITDLATELSISRSRLSIWIAKVFGHPRPKGENVEQKCYDWLVTKIGISPYLYGQRREWMGAFIDNFGHISEATFKRAWKDAVIATGTEEILSKGGRKKNTI